MTTTDLAEALQRIGHLTQESAKALQGGDTDQAALLQAEAEAAWVEARRLGQLHLRHTKRPNLSKVPSVRERAVSAVTALNVPCSPRLIAAYCEARTGEPFDLRAIASIRRDEHRSWKSGSKRDTYLVPALEGPWLVAGRGKFVLSHWPLSQRIIGPLSPRVDHLKVCLHLAAQVESLERDTASWQRMCALLAEYARSVPNALKSPWSAEPDLDLDSVCSAATAELNVIQPEDENWRRTEAERAERRLSEGEQLWGGSAPKIVSAASR